MLSALLCLEAARALRRLRSKSMGPDESLSTDAVEIAPGFAAGMVSIDTTQRYRNGAMEKRLLL